MKKGAHMSFQLEHEIIQLGVEAWPGGVRGQPHAVWINRPGRGRHLRLIAGALAVLVFSAGAVYYIAHGSSAVAAAFPLMTGN